jgi:hypothetical protein
MGRERQLAHDDSMTSTPKEVPLKKHSLSKTLAALGLALAAGSSLADRPMVTDDAVVGDVGTGNIKLRHTDVEGSGLTTVAGAFVPLKKTELARWATAAASTVSPPATAR